MVTHHSERDPEAITPDVIQVPASGYAATDTAEMPRFAFAERKVDMGRISQGTQFTHVFRFTNDGPRPLVITDVRGSCGCTVGRDWPRDPVPPGGEGAITVTFDSEGRSGHQEKSVSVVANTHPPTTILYLEGEVLAPAGALPVE